MHWIDPDSLPALAGTFERFLLNPHGEIDGLLLTDGTEVHTPPHLGDRLARSLAPGAGVTVHGVRPRNVADMVAAVAIQPARGARIVDDGPGEAAHRPKPPKAPDDAVVEGIVRRLLHGPKGEPRGILLRDGTIGRCPPHEAQKFVATLQPGVQVTLRGRGRDTAHGSVLELDSIRVDGKTIALERKKPKPHEHGPKHGPKHGPRHGPKHAHPHP